MLCCAVKIVQSKNCANWNCFEFLNHLPDGNRENRMWAGCLSLLGHVDAVDVQHWGEVGAPTVWSLWASSLTCSADGVGGVGCSAVVVKQAEQVELSRQVGVIEACLCRSKALWSEWKPCCRSRVSPVLVKWLWSLPNATWRVCLRQSSDVDAFLLSSAHALQHTSRVCLQWCSVRESLPACTHVYS